MKSINIFSFLFILGLLVSSCIEHEVIPPPVNTVDLNCSFIGFVNGTQVEFTQNVEGYKAQVMNSEDINPSPALSFKTYGTKISSFYNPQAVRIKFGTLDWDASANSQPTVTMFNDWHTNNAGIPISFSDLGANGIEVEYTDNNGVTWLSRETDPGQEANFQILLFSVREMFRVYGTCSDENRGTGFPRRVLDMDESQYLNAFFHKGSSASI